MTDEQDHNTVRWCDRDRLQAANALAGGKSNESDPQGKGQHIAGAKLDKGKASLRWLQYFRRSLECVADLTRQGALKYSPGGFLEVDEGFERYTDAMLRHFFKELGEDYVTDDPEYIKEVLHATCVAWNALARLEMKLKEIENE